METQYTSSHLIMIWYESCQQMFLHDFTTMVMLSIQRIFPNNLIVNEVIGVLSMEEENVAIGAWTFKEQAKEYEGQEDENVHGTMIVISIIDVVD